MHFLGVGFVGQTMRVSAKSRAALSIVIQRQRLSLLRIVGWLQAKDRYEAFASDEVTMSPHGRHKGEFPLGGAARGAPRTPRQRRSNRVRVDMSQ